MSLRMACPMIGSRPVVGSSNSRIAGSLTSSRARAARFCMPPLSWDGYLASEPESPTRPSSSWTRLRISSSPHPGLFPKRKGYVFIDGHGVEKGPPLEKESEPLPETGQSPALDPGYIHPADEDLTAVRSKETCDVLEKDALSTPAASDQGEQAPFLDLEGDPAEHLRTVERPMEIVDSNRDVRALHRAHTRSTRLPDQKRMDVMK